MTRPIVGILLDEVTGQETPNSYSTRDHYALRKDYFDVIFEAGGEPIGVPYMASIGGQLVSKIAGWVLPGGQYTFPDDWYLDTPIWKPRTPGTRFNVERTLLSEVLDRDCPVLGICAGMQMMAGVFGSKFYQKPESEIASGKVISVEICEGTKLFQAVETKSMQVMSRHVEYVAEVNAPMLISATSANGCIEAIEHTTKKFAVGVQWHPELSQGSGSRRLFARLIEACDE